MWKTGDPSSGCQLQQPTECCLVLYTFQEILTSQAGILTLRQLQKARLRYMPEEQMLGDSLLDTIVV